MERSTVHSISSQIKQLINDARLFCAQELNHRMIQTYWEIRRIIVEHEQGGQAKAQYGAGLLTELAKELTRELGWDLLSDRIYSICEASVICIPKIQTRLANCPGRITAS